MFPSLRQHYALAFSDPADANLRACDLLRGGEVAVEACSPVFYDPKGERLHG